LPAYRLPPVIAHYYATGLLKLKLNHQEVLVMPKDDRDVLETLKGELEFIDKGGYGRSVHTPPSIFQDSLSCLNLGDPQRTRPCGECLLIDFVPSAGRDQTVPCHHIQMSEAGETVGSLEQNDDQQRLEETVKTWLLAKIKQIEDERAAQ
jgi:hypothetical protein